MFLYGHRKSGRQLFEVFKFYIEFRDKDNKSVIRLKCIMTVQSSQYALFSWKMNNFVSCNFERYTIRLLLTYYI